MTTIARPTDVISHGG